ncbi:helix-turn-helix domain-containing protein [Zhouia sp. PK063]|uniref:helix-turn-helix domain-containing protein n=1 Tax=Zhouia sp. PK063 TaxID=3373602 RepID=UPI0037B6A431
MENNEISQLEIEIIHVDHIKFKDNYLVHENIVSPFTRLYYIHKGKTKLILNDKTIYLKEGNLYIIPAFTSCNYFFEKGMDHYFMHCIFSLPNGLNPFFYFQIEQEVKASLLDEFLFKRLFELHPDKRLPDYDPNVYQKTMWGTKNDYSKELKLLWESNGIVQQIFSKFIKQESKKPLQTLLRYNIESIFYFIKNNLNTDITVDELAKKAYLSTDHFSKMFKQAIGIGPKEYIIRQRLEKAQFLLLTTDMPLQQILEYTNFKTLAYFSRIFKKYHGVSPSSYRNMHMLKF